MGKEMTMKPLHGVNIGNLVAFAGSVTTGEGGAIASSECAGFAVAKTGSEAGRYTITLHNPYRKIWGVLPTVIGPDDNAYTTDKGLLACVRDNDIASDGTIELQFIAPTTVVVTETATSTYVDAELPDSTVFKLVIFASR